MIWLSVATTLLRELLRACATPFRLLAYLPARHHWRREAQAALAAAADAPIDAAETSLGPFFSKAGQVRGDRPHLFVSAGEASGEGHAARLVTALDSEVRVTAFGGQTLVDAGAELRYGLSEHAVMGVGGVLKQLPLILRAFATYLRMLRDDPPDLVVLVDYPGLHLVMAKAAKRRKVPVLHYIAPQYWAWGPWRMRRYRRAVDATLTILPFETEFFRRHNVPAAYIGHPLLDELAQHPAESEATDRARRSRLLVLLPGSRRAEIEANLPGLLGVAKTLRARDPELECVLPHKNARRTELIRSLLRAHGADWVDHREGPLTDWLASARLVLAKSGTGSLEACLHGNPTIVVYQLGGFLSGLGYRNILSVPWIAGANLIAARAVVPEHCFTGDDGWRGVATDAERLWFDEDARREARRGLAEVRRRLGAPGATARRAGDRGSIPRRSRVVTQPLLDLRAFLDLLRREGELTEIDAPVDPDLEAAEVHRRVIAAGGPALLFRNVRGSPWPCVTNLFGTARRVELAFGRRRSSSSNGSRRSPTSCCRRASAGCGSTATCSAHCCASAAARCDAPPCSRSRTRQRGSAGCRCCARGARTAAPSSPCRWSTPNTPRASAPTSACTGCSGSRMTPRACTCRSARAADSTSPRANNRAARCPSPSMSGDRRR